MSSDNARPGRNEWYRRSLVNVHFDNHSSPVGKGQSLVDLTKLLGTMKCSMLQVSAQSSGPATYPTQVNVNDPDIGGYDTVGTFKRVARRLKRRLCIYMSTDLRPLLIKTHPDWASVDASGQASDKVVCQRPHPQKHGYLYEGFLPQIREVIEKYDPDGFWFDGDLVVQKPCWCPRCVELWTEDTGLDAPRDSDSPDWRRWLDWHHDRFDEYRRIVAEEIHWASPKAIYTSNWSWGWTPEPVPDFVDTLSGDAWNAANFGLIQHIAMRWGAQRTPWDVMSFTYPPRAFKGEASLQRSLQEAGLTLASGGNWFVWGFSAGPVPPCGVEWARHCIDFVRDREYALGPTTSLSQVAVLDSETTWKSGGDTGRSGIKGIVSRAARNLQEAHYQTDIVNEGIFRAHRTRYRVLVIPEQQVVSPEMLAELRMFVEGGGLLLLTGGSLLDQSERERTEVESLLGVTRSAPSSGGQARLELDRHGHIAGDIWKARATDAHTIRCFDDGQPALTRKSVGKGTVAWFAAADLPYPDGRLLARILRALAVGPSYCVGGGGTNTPLLCSLRARDGEVLLHITDLSTRIDGKLVKLDSSGNTDPLPALGGVEVALPFPCAATSARAVPTGTLVETSLTDGILTVKLSLVQTHAAVALVADVRPPLALLPPDTPLPQDLLHPA